MEDNRPAASPHAREAETGAPDTTTTGDVTTSTTERTTTTSSTLPGGELAACDNPEGFTISAPVDWATNDGEVVPACSQFNPEPFDVPEGTDERVAAITAYVDPVPFATATQPEEGSDEDRAVTAIDGRQAVRISGEVSGVVLDRISACPSPNGDPVCTERPEADQVHTIALQDLNRTCRPGSPERRCGG